MTRHDGRLAPLRVLGIGGSLRRPSQSETALRMALRGAEDEGAVTEIIAADNLRLPLYPSPDMAAHPNVMALLAAVRRADGLILASPAYHGTMSGALKNALDHLQYLSDDDPPYLDGRAIGVLATGDGTQAVVQTVDALRSVVHALRAWPTPMGVAIHEAGRTLQDGAVADERVAASLRAMGAQVVEFAQARRALHALASTSPKTTGVSTGP